MLFKKSINNNLLNLIITQIIDKQLMIVYNVCVINFKIISTVFYS